MTTLSTGLNVQISQFGDSTIRIRASTTETFSESLSEHFGFVESGVVISPAREQGARSEFPTSAGHKVIVDRESGVIELEFADGEPITALRVSSSGSALAGPEIRSTIEPDEAFYGLGFQRTALNVRGSTLNWQRAYRSAEATVPFFLSSAGYGLFSNNTWHHRFDFTGDTDYVVSMADGEIDFYVFFGPSFRDILELYTSLTGRPKLLPRWMMGLLYICRYFEDQSGVLDIAEKFRARNIPCDSIGLEPGWEDVPYSMTWDWSPDRFPNPKAMISRLHELDYRFELWESGAAPKRDYIDPEVRRAWYSRRIENSIDIGVDFYKQDDPYPRMLGSSDEADMELDSRLEGYGDVTGMEAANLANSLYSETTFDEFTRNTGKRAVTMFHSYMASVASHRWGYGWAGDFAAGCGLLCASMSGHSTVSLDMHTGEPSGIHYSFFTPVPIIDSWASYKEPWLYSEAHENMIRDYAVLRQRLWPYFYQAHHQSATCGLPMMRPMILEAQHDPNVRSLVGQHMLGDYLLVGLGDEDHQDVYLPQGLWVDYWTGKSTESIGERVRADYPAGVGGPLYVKAGAIIPTSPIETHVGTDPLELIILDMYPHGTQSIELYEDDGSTPAYLSGAFAFTSISSSKREDLVEIAIGDRRGRFEDISEKRAFLLRIFTESMAGNVSVDGDELPRYETTEQLLSGTDAGWSVDPIEGCVVVKPSSTWRVVGSTTDSAHIDRADVEWSQDADTFPRNFNIALTLIDDAMPRGRLGFDNISHERELPHEPLRLTIAANPPERVALKGGGDWLKHKTTIYGATYRGDELDRDADLPVTLTVTNANGKVLREENAKPQHGQIVFSNIDYVPNDTRFELTCGDSKSDVVTIRDIPEVPGIEYSELLSTKG